MARRTLSAGWWGSFGEFRGRAVGQIYDGKVSGQVELTETHVIIRRKGVLSFITQGLKGEKRIPYGSITSVQFKGAGLTNGYIQFGVQGGVENRGGVFAATQDENTVMFRKSVQSQFEHLRDAVERRAHGGQGSGTMARTKADAYAELGQLGELHKQGILTDEEFAQQKARLLG